MQSLETSSALERNAFQAAVNSSTEINSSQDSGNARGVKRLRVDDTDTNSTSQMNDSGCSFLETKWAVNTSKPKRESFFCDELRPTFSH